MQPTGNSRPPAGRHDAHAGPTAPGAGGGAGAPPQGRPGTRARSLAIRLGIVAAAVGVVYLLRPDTVESTLASPLAILKIIGIVVALVVLSRLLSRFVRLSWLRTVLFAVPVTLLAIFLVLPVFRDVTVDEALPGATTGAGSRAGSEAGAPGAPAATDPRLIGQAVELHGINHDATGTAAVHELADGSRLIRLENLDVENGPDYNVYLVAGADRTEPGDGVRIDRLKGNRGDQNYPIPASVNTSGTQTVLIYCTAFDVPVANATLTL